MKRVFAIEDYVGRRFGERVVIGPIRTAERGGMKEILCRCNDGHEKWIRISRLEAGEGHSCRICHCRRIAKQSAEEQFHPLRHTPGYRVWKNMLRRVKSDESYVRRGITCCSEWNRFEVFLGDMGQPPIGKPELDRINGHEGYSKSNCRWATHEENNANRTNLRMLTYGGRTMCIAHWEKYLGIPLETLRKKLRFDRPLSTIMAECGFQG